jgi:hypothetical protein
MKTKLLMAAAGLIFSAITGYADDVKVVSEKDSFCASNGKINLEMKKDGPVKLTDVKNEAVVDISFMDKSGKEKLKATRFSIETNTPKSFTVSLHTGSPEKMLASFTVSKNTEYVLVYPGRDTNGTVLEMKSEISVLPDMLAEDYLYFPDKIKSRSRVPTDSYCIMNLMNGGNSVAACLWTTDDTKAYLGKNSPDSKTIDYNLIEAGKLKRLYIGILSAPGIWHTVKEKLNAEEFQKVDWKAPFAAQWLMTMKLDKGLLMPVNDGNFDTWVIPERIRDGSSVALRTGVGMIKKDIWNVWGSLHGTFLYPLYVENGEFFAKLPKTGGISYNPDYPPVIYAYKYERSYYFGGEALLKSKIILPYDKLAEVLSYHGIEHLTAVSSQESAYPATCAVTAEMLRYYKDDQAEEKKNVIIKQVDAMDKFVDLKDKRFNDYRKWAADEIKSMNEISAKNVNLKALADELIAYLSLVGKNYEAAKEKVKTPEVSAALSAKYIELIDDKTLSPEKKEELVDKLGRDIRTMGGQRDNLVAQMRLTVKSIRYHLSEKLAGKLSQEEEEVVAKLRKDCGDILWAKHGHEGK